MDEYFRHCELVRGDKHQVAWIAERGAKVGNVVKLKDCDDEQWTVASVAGRICRDQALAMRDAYRTQREASDI